LKHDHPYRKLKKAFNGCQEDKTTPPPLTSDGVYNQVIHIEVTYGKAIKHSGVKNIEVTYGKAVKRSGVKNI